MRCGALLLLAALLAGCGGGGGEGEPTRSNDTRAPATGAPEGGAGRAARDWPRYGYDAQRSNNGPARAGLHASELGSLRRRTVRLPGTVDSSPIYLHDVRVGGKVRGALFVTTSYGRTLAIDARSGRRLWQFVPPGIDGWEGSPQITNATPAADPSRRWIYSVSPDGRIHKLSVRSGREAPGGAWPVSITRDPAHEKIAPALNLAGRYVLQATGGYIGDAPPYQGHVVAIDRRSGRIAHVFNTLCSDRRTIMQPSSCSEQLSAIWARAGVVVEPGNHRLYVTTGNAPFDGRTAWGDSVLQLAPGATRLLQNWTPPDHEALAQSDSDLGSTAPALLPAPRGRRPRFALQGGKDGRVRLLSLARLNGTGRAGPETGGELQSLEPPRGRLAFTTPAVLATGGRVLVFTADFDGTVAYELRGRPPRLHVLWEDGTPGSSPLIAGGLVWIYDVTNGGINVYRPLSGRRVGTLDSGPGHWNSPIVVDGLVALPEGDANDHETSGVLRIWSR